MARNDKKADKPHDGDSPAPPRDRVIDAFMKLASERPIEEISLTDIAVQAGLTLADFRGLFSSKRAILAALSERIDRIVLEGTSDEMADESAKERLFDVLMRRLDAMAPYRAGLEGVAAWSRRNPLSALRFNRVVRESMRFMLEAAGIDAEGRVGRLKLHGLAIAWTRIFGVWLRDEDPGLAVTMAELDRELKRGDMLVARAEDVDRLVAPLREASRGLIGAGVRLGRARRRRDRESETATNNL